MIAYILFNAVVVVIASFGNLLVMVVVALDRLLYNMRSFLLASMALGDFLLMIIIIVPRVVSVAYKKWIFGESAELCQGTGFITRLLYLNTILHLCAVSYERYRAIVKDPFSYDGRITPKKVIISISVLWIVPTMICLGPFLGWGGYEYIPEIYACGQRWDKESTFPYLIMSFVAPLLFIFILNYKGIKVVRRLERQVNIQLGEIQNEKNGQMSQLDQFTNQSGINCKQEDDRNMGACDLQEEYQGTGQVITEEETCQDPTELWKDTLRKAGQANTWNKHSQPDAGCSQQGSCQQFILAQHGPNGSKIESDPQEKINSDATEKPTTHQSESTTASSVERVQNTLSSAVIQERIPTNARNINQGGLVNILKECKASRDVLIIIGAFLACFLPTWIHGVYQAIKGEPYSSVVFLWASSFYSTTALCNPIIYSMRKKDFRRAVRSVFKNLY